MGNQVALVTGAGAKQGLGRGIAYTLGEAGYDIALHCSSNRAAAEETAQEICALGVRCEVIQADLSKYEGVVDLFKQFDKAFDRIDLLVNNAGVTIGGSMLDMDIETFDMLNGIDWRGGFFCTQFAAKRMIKNDIAGCIVLITSNQATLTFGGSAVYGSVKAALRKFAGHAALELSHYGIRVLSIAPGFVDTGHPRMGEKEPTYNQIPMSRWVSPQELGKMILYAVSPEAASLTGVELLVDGGAHLLTGAGGMAYLRERAEKKRAEIKAAKE